MRLGLPHAAQQRAPGSDHAAAQPGGAAAQRRPRPPQPQRQAPGPLPGRWRRAERAAEHLCLRWQHGRGITAEQSHSATKSSMHNGTMKCMLLPTACGLYEASFLHDIYSDQVSMHAVLIADQARRQFFRCDTIHVWAAKYHPLRMNVVQPCTFSMPCALAKAPRRASAARSSLRAAHAAASSRAMPPSPGAAAAAAARSASASSVRRSARRARPRRNSALAFLASCASTCGSRTACQYSGWTGA